MNNPTFPESTDRGEESIGRIDDRESSLCFGILFFWELRYTDYQVKNYITAIAMGCRILEISSIIRKTLNSASERTSQTFAHF